MLFKFYPVFKHDKTAFVIFVLANNQSMIDHRVKGRALRSLSIYIVRLFRFFLMNDGKG